MRTLLNSILALVLLASLGLFAGCGGETASQEVIQITPTPTSVPTESPTPVVIPPSEAIQIVSSTAYDEDHGYPYLLIVGEVQNLLDQNMRWAKITADLYDSRGSLMATLFTYDLNNVIQPGEKAPFYLQPIYYDFPMGRSPATYSLSATYVVTGYDGLEGLIIPFHVGTATSKGYKVSGRVKNGSDFTARDVEIVATFYDSRGDVIAVDDELAEDPILLPGEETTFEVSTEPLTVYPTRYSLHVQAWGL